MILAVSVALLKAVTPPFVLASARPPFVPVYWSQARNVIPVAIVPLKFAFGTKRIRVFARSEANRRADVLLTLPSAFQVPPLLVEYCQDPLDVSAAITAIPSAAPGSGSVIRSPPALAIRAEVSVPAF